MVSPAFNHAVFAESFRNSALENDPPPVTPFDTIADIGILRLRYYAPLKADVDSAPVVLVYSLFKRPYILDLDKDRSVIRCFLERGQPVYLVDWRAPLLKDAGSGIDAYVRDLASAVEKVREHSGADQVSITGICFGGLISLIYTALNPDKVRHFVPIATGIERRTLIPPVVIEQTVMVHGNVPAWWVQSVLNARVPAPPLVPQYLATELNEPELANVRNSKLSPVCERLARWIYSDMPFAAQLARDIMGSIYWEGQLADDRLRVGDEPVALERITCPLLNISGSRDQLVPTRATTRLIELTGSKYARNLVFPSGHIGLMASRDAHEDLWPRVSMWMRLID